MYEGPCYWGSNRLPNRYRQCIESNDHYIAGMLCSECYGMVSRLVGNYGHYGSLWYSHCGLWLAMAKSWFCWCIVLSFMLYCVLFLNFCHLDLFTTIPVILTNFHKLLVSSTSAHMTYSTMSPSSTSAHVIYSTSVFGPLNSCYVFS